MVGWKMIKLEDSSVLSLLPSSVLSDDIIAAAKTLDIHFKKTVKAVGKINFYNDLYSLEDAILDHLLYQHHVTDLEGKALATTKEEKVNLILNSSYMHEIKGTAEAIENVLRILNIRGKVSEWFEYGGDPYYFRVEIEHAGFGERQYQLLMQLINIYKNKRSWLETVIVYITTQATAYQGCITMIGVDVTTNPFTPNETITEAYEIGTGATYIGATITNY